MEGARLDTLLMLTYEVTHRCMRRCTYCYPESEFSPRFGLLPLNRVKEVLVEAQELRVQSIVLGGDDLFTKGDLINIIYFDKSIPES